MSIRLLTGVWSLAVNAACLATKHLYLHKLLKKTPYEPLTGNKPNVSYFIIFGSRCYILQKRLKSSKFAPKVYEGFLLGYDLPCPKISNFGM
jgi:hypothetical protein